MAYEPPHRPYITTLTGGTIPHLTRIPIRHLDTRLAMAVMLTMPEATGDRFHDTFPPDAWSYR